MFDLAPYDPHQWGHHDVTSSQIALLLLWIISVVCWGLSLFRRQHPPTTDEENGGTTKEFSDVNGDAIKGDDKDNDSSKAKSAQNFSKVPQALDFHSIMLRLVVLGLIMGFFFLCDYLKIFPQEDRIYTRDTFLFLVFLLFLAAAVSSVSDTSDKILNRDQTEEWKGWMQVMFVWYHYFAAKEWYNWIRIYIACYVWMTGFGNFSFFWVKKDYSLWRFMKMFFRLNFLVIIICATVSNEYMVYYICAMHTYWFLSVYFTMAILPSWNTQRFKMLAKFVVYAVCNYIIFDVPGVANIIFRPLWLILGFNDGRGDVMHEWAFRAGLDHWICFVGMLCAYNYPHFEGFMQYLETQNEVYFLCVPTGNLIKALVGGVVLCAYCTWHNFILPLEKYTYNAVHPYTSFIPVLTYIYFRNVSKYLRGKYLHMFAWLGKITLETYLSQLHIYLQSNAKNLIGYFHGYPLLNFAFATIVYLPISNCLFHITLELSTYLLPKEMKERRRRMLISGICIALTTILGRIIKAVFV